MTNLLKVLFSLAFTALRYTAVGYLMSRVWNLLIAPQFNLPDASIINAIALCIIFNSVMIAHKFYDVMLNNKEALEKYGRTSAVILVDLIITILYVPTWLIITHILVAVNK